MSGNNKEYVDKLNFLDGIAVDILKKFDGLTVGDAKDILSLVESNVDCIGKLKCKGKAFDKLVSEHFSWYKEILVIYILK